jgi:DegV family protein with EDD domain
VQTAAEAAKKGLSLEAVNQCVLDAMNKTQFYAALPDLTYVTKGGRMSAKKRKFLDFFNLTPILKFDREGKITLATCFFGKSKVAKKLAKFISNKINSKKAYRILVSHSDCEAQAQTLHNQLKRLIPKIESIYIVRTGSTLGAHTGPQSFAIAIQEMA